MELLLGFITGMGDKPPSKHQEREALCNVTAIQKREVVEGMNESVIGGVDYQFCRI